MGVNSETCPRCGEALEWDEADVGIGVIRGPAGCPACHWIEADGRETSMAKDDTMGLASDSAANMSDVAFVEHYARIPRAPRAQDQRARILRLAGRDPSDACGTEEAIRDARLRLRALEALAAGKSWATMLRWQRRIVGFASAIDAAPGWPSIRGIADTVTCTGRLADVLHRSPVDDAVLLVVLRAKGDGVLRELDIADWQLEYDGELGLERVDVSAWLGANHEGLDVETLTDVINLDPGESYTGGGGAAAEWTVRRVA
jgi:hypothetical protein